MQSSETDARIGECRNDLRTEFARRLKAERTRLGLTQERLAEKLEVHPMNISRLERGIGYPGFLMLRKLCDLFGGPDFFLMLDLMGEPLRPVVDDRQLELPR